MSATTPTVAFKLSMEGHQRRPVDIQPSIWDEGVPGNEEWQALMAAQALVKLNANLGMQETETEKEMQNAYRCRQRCRDVKRDLRRTRRWPIEGCRCEDALEVSIHDGVSITDQYHCCF